MSLKVIKTKYWASLLSVFLVYAIAIFVGWSFLHYVNWPISVIWKTFIADVLATIIVYLFSVLFANTSVYDPYWSVIPIFIAFYWLIINNSTDIYFKPLIVVILVSIWGIRLTVNWLRGWKGLTHEDWRYNLYRKKHSRFIFELINLFGLQMLPTFLVFLGCLSIYTSVNVKRGQSNYLDIIGGIITMVAIVIETISDEQRRVFAKRRREGDIINIGLWKYSRHPNYFGEISFWWGLYFFALGSSLSNWWMIIGPISISLLFIFISIPLMENRLLSKYSVYKDYKHKVSSLVPLPVKKK